MHALRLQLEAGWEGVVDNAHERECCDASNVAEGALPSLRAFISVPSQDLPTLLRPARPYVSRVPCPIVELLGQSEAPSGVVSSKAQEQRRYLP